MTNAPVPKQVPRIPPQEDGVVLPPRGSPATGFDSKFTAWGRISREQRAEARWHGFPMIGNVNISYCGMESFGRKRYSPPRRESPVCEKCAEACGFRRRSARGGHKRTKGGTRLGTVTERMERAVDRAEAAADKLEELIGLAQPGGDDSHRGKL